MLAHPLPAGVAGTLSVRHIRVNADPAVYQDYRRAKSPDEVNWTDGGWELEFNSTVEQELGEELRRCSGGARPVDITVRVTARDLDPRLRSLVDGDGVDTMSALAEIIEPASGSVLGRYQLVVASRSGNLIERVVGDGLMSSAEMLGREACLQIFGRNPRPPSIMNATG